MRNAKAAANERIRAVQLELGIDDGNPLPFLCECDDVACRASGRFVVGEGHPVGGRVVDAGEGTSSWRSDVDERTRRIGENEALYRTINEKIEDLNTAFGMVTESMAIVCECGDLGCTQQIELDMPMYEHVRSDAVLFVVVPGHEIPDVETIVEEHDGFNVIRKDPGGPAEVARDLATRD